MSLNPGEAVCRDSRPRIGRFLLHAKPDMDVGAARG
jgi:hypothetical protein